MKVKSAITLVIILGGLLGGGLSLSSQAPGRAPRVAQAVRDRAARDGRVRVLVELNLSPGDDAARILSALPPSAYRVARRFRTVPYIALEVTPAGLAALDAAGSDVVRVVSDEILRPVLADSVPLIQGDQVWAQGFDGSGTMVAVIDTGVDASHPFLAGKVVEEACYSSSSPQLSQSICPNGQDQQIGPGSAAPCPLSDCIHGTHVAGIATGNGAQAGQPFSGVAKGASLMAVQVFSTITDPISCGGIAPCLGAFTSDIIAGLERVVAVAPHYNIASVNMSLGGGSFASPCDSEPYKPAIDALRALGIASAVAAGNNGSPTALTSPGCISTAVSVGSTDKSDNISWFSNLAPFLKLFAPGESITSSIPGGGYEPLSGTSMATPHVAGAWAVLRQAVPGASVDTILAALQQTGKPIDAGGYNVPRVQLFEALATFVPITNPAPTATALSPTHVRAATSAFTLTVNGSGFDAFSVVRWNGADRPTTTQSTQKTQASIPASDLATAGGPALVTVFNPAPGGGETAALTFTIDPPPTLTLSAATVGPAAQETVTLRDGFGGALDWLALAQTGAPDTSYLQWTYVGYGVTARSWTVTMPTAGGTYEFRLFANNKRAATSPPVTVDPSINPVPTAASLSPTRTVAGTGAFTLTVTGNNFISSSVVQWNGSGRPTTFVSATQLQAAIGAGDIASSGTAQVTVFTLSPGGGTTAALAFPVDPAPSLTVSATSVSAGAPVTVTLTGGFGGAGDWLALAATGSANSSYLQFTYVGTGVTTRTWTVTMPSTPGTYEFRLFINYLYNRVATSPAVTVTVPQPTLSVSATRVAPSTFVTATLANGFGGSLDYITLAAAGSPDGSYLQVTYVGTGVKSRTWTVTMPATAGGYEFRLFANNARVATSPQVTVDPSLAPPPNPVLTVSATSVLVSTPVTVTLTGGFGGSSDWIAFAATGSSNTSYINYTYIGVGQTSKTWTVTMPATPGTYEFRLFLNNTYTLAATSPTVSVNLAVTPVLSVNTTSVGPGGSATVTLTNGTGGSLDWIALAAVGSANTSYLQWTYVGANVTTRTWTVTMPTAGGTYEFRLFLSGGYTRIATSPSVSVIVPPPVLSVSATTVAPGASVTVTLVNGAGGSLDWLALAPVGSANTTYLQWTYVGSGVTTRTWTVTMPTTTGAYEFRLFVSGGYTRAATSPTVTVSPP